MIYAGVELGGEHTMIGETVSFRLVVFEDEGEIFLGDGGERF